MLDNRSWQWLPGDILGQAAPRVSTQSGEVRCTKQLLSTSPATMILCLRTHGGQLLLWALCACAKNWPIAKLPARPLTLTSGPDAKYASLLPTKFPREDVESTNTLAYSAL